MVQQLLKDTIAKYLMILKLGSSLTLVKYPKDLCQKGARLHNRISSCIKIKTISNCKSCQKTQRKQLFISQIHKCRPIRGEITKTNKIARKAKIYNHRLIKYQLQTPVLLSQKREATSHPKLVPLPMTSP